MNLLFEPQTLSFGFSLLLQVKQQICNNEEIKLLEFENHKTHYLW